MSDRSSRLAPLTAIPFAVLTLIGVFVSNSNSPDSKASGQAVIAYYQAHGSDSKTSDFVFIFAFIFFMFFAGSLRAYLRRTPASEAPGALLLAGATLMTAGIAIVSGLDLALADQPSRLTPDAAQALNLLNQNMFFAVAAGGCVFGISAGVAILRGAALPKWMGWVVIVLGLAAASPAFFIGLVGLLLWTIIAGILMYLRGGPVTAARAPDAPAVA